MSVARRLRAWLIAPIFAPVGYWIAMTAGAAMDGVRISTSHALRELLVIMSFGLPLAWIVAAAWGAPVVHILERFRLLRAWSVIAVGGAGGGIVAMGFAMAPHGDLFRVQMPPVLAVLLGAGAGGVWWWIRARQPGQSSATPRSHS